MPPPRFLLALLRGCGSLDGADDQVARAVARRPTAELIGLLRATADRSVGRPGVGPGDQLTDTYVHLRDVARPLRWDTSPPRPDLGGGASFTTSLRAQIGFVPRGQLDELALAATDTE